MTLRLKHTVAAFAATGALAVGLTVSVAGAGADTEPIAATGNTTIQFNNQVIKALQKGCGALTATSTGGGTLVTTGAGKINATFPITGVVVNPENGHGRITHAGSGIELSNACYDIRLTNLYIQDFGEGSEYDALDVLALVKNEDGTDREMVFTLNLSTANGTLTQRGAVKIRSINVLFSQDGAAQFNLLAGGTPDEAGNVSGPFYEGLQAGKARTTVRTQFSPPPPAE